MLRIMENQLEITSLFNLLVCAAAAVVVPYLVFLSELQISPPQ